MKTKNKSVKPTDFEVVMSRVKHCTYDQKVALAKYLASMDGVKMLTPADANVIIEREVKARVEQALRAQTSHILVPGVSSR